MNNMDEIDQIRLNINQKLDPDHKSRFGQYMTPNVVCEFMSKLFTPIDNDIKLLDCGAGIGSLAISAINILKKVSCVDLWEIDPIMQDQLYINIQSMNTQFEIYPNDFLVDAVNLIMFEKGKRYTHAILNPPYKKINSNSEHRHMIRKVGIETVNLYTAFLALTIKLMENNGQIVAIIPRSFCNGLYYKSFRAFLLKTCSIEHIHIFESRKQVFKDDDVLQENMIIKLVKNKQKQEVIISQSIDHSFKDYQKKVVAFEDILKIDDPELFIHIPISDHPVNHGLFNVPLDKIELNVSTGPVVDFRMKYYLEQNPNHDTAPLLYPHHFVDQQLQYPVEHKKPNAIKINPSTQKWLMPNDGYYVIVKRFSSKEEKRRVVAYIVDPNHINASWIGFENHWNVFHTKKHGLEKMKAFGLACFLNSSIFDDYFRTFSGHTQVNATDLKNIKYPTIQMLYQLGKNYQVTMNQIEIDNIINGVDL